MFINSTQEWGRGKRVEETLSGPLCRLTLSRKVARPPCTLFWGSFVLEALGMHCQRHSNPTSLLLQFLPNNSFHQSFPPETAIFALCFWHHRKYDEVKRNESKTPHGPLYCDDRASFQWRREAILDSKRPSVEVKANTQEPRSKSLDSGRPFCACLNSWKVPSTICGSRCNSEDCHENFLHFLFRCLSSCLKLW